jgi:RNA polymerase sigma factor (sigma-70 family)
MMVRGVGKAIIQDVHRLYAEGTTAGASDEQLLARFTALRDQSNLAFEAIVRRHGPMVLETCRRLLRNDLHAAEDAFQATFLVLARRADAINVRPSGSLAPWLHEVACRTARKLRVAAIRRAKRELRVARGGDASLATDRHPLVEIDEYRILHEEVLGLPEKYRAAIVLCYLEGLTHDEAATKLHWPVGTVRGYLARARDLLRTRLVRRGVAPAVAVGLLESRANAAVLPPLIESVLRSVAQGVGASTAAAVSGAVARGLAISRMKGPFVALVVLAVGASGAGLVASSFHSRFDAVPAVVPMVAVQAAEKPGRRERLDLQGDPLPNGAVARLGTSRFNHGNNISGLAYTPDGKALLSLGGDGFVRVWDPTTGQLQRTMIPDGSLGSRLYALSADGQRLMTAERSRDGIFRLWDFQSGRELLRAPVPEPKGYFSLMAYSPDGHTLATSLFDGSIVFRDVETLAELRRVKVAARYVQHIAFSPDGRLLAATGENELPHQDRAMPIGGFGTGNRKRRRPAPNPAEKSSLIIWDVTSGREVRRIDIQGRHPNELVFTPDGKSLVAPYCDGTIRFHDVTNGRESSVLTGEGISQATLALARDGRLVASADDTGGDAAAVIHLWDVARRVELRQLVVGQDSANLAFSPDGKTLASVTREKVFRLWDVATGREIKPGPSHRSSVACLVVSPRDDTVITGGYDDAIRHWDSITGRELAVIGTHPEPVYDLAISPDGRFLVSSSIEGSAVRLTDLTAIQNPPRPLPINPGSRGRGLAFSPNGRLVFSSGKISEVETGREVASLLDELGKPFHPWAWACFTPDGTGLVASNGHKIWLWDVTGGKPVRKLGEPGRQIMSVAVSPDGRFLLVGVDNAARLWHLSTGREVKTNMRHDASYVVAAFSPDGRLIVSGCGYDMKHDDPSVRVWEVASGQEVRRFVGHRAGVYSVAFFPDGRRLASAAADAMAMVWDLSLPADGPAQTADPSTPMGLEKLWADLAGDAATAYRAIWRMSANGEQAVPFLAERLQPIRLDDHDKDTSIGPIATGETLRRLRAIAILEKLNTPATRRVLERMATGLAGARETRDASAALRRMRQ